MASGVILVASFLLLLLCFNLRLTNSPVAATLAVLLTLMCGGVGGFKWLLANPSWYTLRSYVASLLSLVRERAPVKTWWWWWGGGAHVGLGARRPVSSPRCLGE
jgi:hypothetical protein